MGRPKHTKPDKNQTKITNELIALGYDVDDVHDLPGIYDIIVSGEIAIPFNDGDNSGYLLPCSLRVELKSDKGKLSKNQQAEESLKAWVYEVRYSSWRNASELKSKYGNASIINSKRVVFNIKGNDYRLIVEVEYKLMIVFIVWFGTHVEYDKINAKTISYEN